MRDYEKAELIAKERTDIRQEILHHEAALFRVAFVWIAAVIGIFSIAVTNERDGNGSSQPDAPSATAPAEGTTTSEAELPPAVGSATPEEKSFIEIIARHRGELLFGLSQVLFFLAMIVGLLLVKIAIFGAYVQVLEDRINDLAEPDTITAFESEMVDKYITNPVSAYFLGCAVIVVYVLIVCAWIVRVLYEEGWPGWVLVVEVLIAFVLLVWGCLLRKKAFNCARGFLKVRKDQVDRETEAATGG